MYEQLMSNTDEAVKNIIAIMKGKRVPFLQGSPGIGKSDIVKAVANFYKLKVIDIRLSQVEPTELLGFPFLDGSKCDYKPLKYFPLQGEPVPQGYNGWLLFFDELNSAGRDVQAAAYRILLDREVGNNVLNDNCYMVAAGNLSTDKAIVNKLSSALQSRLIHLFIEPDIDQWMNWAYKNEIDYRIIGFLQQRKDLLWKFDTNSTDVTYPCPRTWHMLSDIIKDTSNLDGLFKVMAGTVGQGPAIEFNAFQQLGAKLPKFEEIIKDPTGTRVPQTTGECYYMTALLAHRMDKNNWQPIITYSKGLPPELLTVLFRMALTGPKANELRLCSGVCIEAGKYVAENI